MSMITNSPNRQELNKNYLDQVILRFDFPIIFGLADTDSDGRLVTARKSEMLEDIRNMLLAKFPVYAPVEQKSFNFEINEKTSPQFTEIPMELIHTFKSQDGSKLCEISINNFVFVTKGGNAYTNFESFLNEFWEIWEKTAEKLRIPTIVKAGLRKINIFPVHELIDSSLEKSIKADFLPPFKGPDFESSSFASFIGRQSFDVADGWKCNYQYGFHPKTVDGKKAYFFDTDIFRDEAVSPNDIKNKLQSINQIHWELYCSGLTKDFYEILKVKK
jgi:uncharacterized protein (TIGR04255 family)